MTAFILTEICATDSSDSYLLANNLHSEMLKMVPVFMHLPYKSGVVTNRRLFLIEGIKCPPGICDVPVSSLHCRFEWERQGSIDKVALGSFTHLFFKLDTVGLLLLMCTCFLCVRQKYLK